MERIKSCKYPELSPEFTELFNDPEKVLIIVGVIGKSNLPNCNKMSCFDLFSCHASFVDNEIDRKEDTIKFFYETNSNFIYVHFDTTYDVFIANDLIKSSDFEHFLPFNSMLRTGFARILLFATQICHIVVMVEPSSSFDTSYLSIFKGLKILREKYLLKFLPKLLKNTSAGNILNKEVRLCSPRFLFLFEKLGRSIDNLTSHEIEMEDSIYQMLRTNFIITNNSQLSLFSIPKNKKFLFVNTDEKLNSDPIADSLDLLLKYIDKSNDDDFQYKPYRGYGVQYSEDDKVLDLHNEKKRSFLTLINEHVEEAYNHGFDDSISKFRGKGHFVRPTMKTWYEMFKLMHKILVTNPKNSSFEAKDPDYNAFLENFHKVLDIDDQLFKDACTHGHELSLANYLEHLPHHYSKSYHEAKVEAALEVFYKYARGPKAQRLDEKLKDNFDTIWMNGRQQCEIPSLRGNPCIMVSKHASTEGTQHLSGIIYISACNCGKTQGKREDPYNIRKANFEFYQLMMASCTSCEKADSYIFPIFVPSSSEYKAAEVTNRNVTSLILSEYSNRTPCESKTEHQLHLSASQRTQASECDLSLGGSISDDERTKKKSSKKPQESDDDDDVNEIVVKIGELGVREERPEASTTEYLPGMLLSTSPSGLLPQFPSWSLMYIASSSFYSHNTGLTESQMPGFLSGTNFLLAWEVKVRLERVWVENYEKNRRSKKSKQSSTQQSSNGTYFTLKIFVGMEYECGRGHRFMMSSNDKVLRGGSKTSSASLGAGCGSKIVFSDMPLYFPCPCKNNSIAQLARVHIVTPKAPVNINLNPKVRIRRETEMIFTTGWDEPAKLSQSAYWVLRLPYVYQGEGDPIPSPLEVPASIDALRYGCLIQGMFGIKENEAGD